MRPVIIVFAKAPVPGRVKTRLVPPLSPVDAAALHAAFVRDTLESLEALNAADVELHTDVETDAWRDLRVPRRLQHEGGLGLKMLKALAEALLRGHPRAVILGGDSPALPPAHLLALLGLDADIALGPADDGGFYAIAARRTHPEMFAGARWSSPHALADTVRASTAARLSTAIGPAWFDIDSIDDVARLFSGKPIPRHTAAALRSLATELLATGGRERA